MAEWISAMFKSLFFRKNVDDDHLHLPDMVSDSEFAEELQIQEVLQASLADYNQIISFEAGESSRNYYCEICMEEKGKAQMFNLESCSHSFCSVCVAKHVQAKISGGNHIVNCPESNCNSVIEPPACRDIIPADVLSRWEEAISEATILESEKFYCPFKDCSAMLVNDRSDREGEVITESECPVCRRLFCAKCKVPWHFGIGCEEFILQHERGGDGDLMLHILAKKKNWSKCPNCKFLVDKFEGCVHMTCRCGLEFCYKCGKKWSKRHWRTCQ